MAPCPSRMERETKTEVTEMDTVTRIILCVIILGGIIALLLMNRSKGAKFDERQLIYRGRAVSLAFGTLLTCLGIVLLLNTPDLPWLDVPSSYPSPSSLFTRSCMTPIFPPSRKRDPAASYFSSSRS